MIEITSGKQPLRLANPVIGASGIFGYAGEYAKLIDLSKLGAIVTNAVTLRPRRATLRIGRDDDVVGPWDEIVPAVTVHDRSAVFARRCAQQFRHDVPTTQLAFL